MSSMFKKKGGLAFKPKIPSARPRPAVPAADLEVVKDVVEPESVSVAAVASPSVDVREISNHATGTSESENIDSPESSGIAKATPIITSAPPTQDVSGLKPSEHTHLPDVRQPGAPEILKTSPTAEAEAATAQSQHFTPPSSHKPREPLPIVADDNIAPELRDPPRPPQDVQDSAPETAKNADSSQASLSVTQETTPAATPVPSAGPRTRSRRKAPGSAQEHVNGDVDAESRPKKRQRKSTENEDGTTAAKPRQRKSSSHDGTTTPRTRARRARSVTPDDAETQIVDLQSLKMTDLTKDLHIGKKFSRHDELRERERQSRIKTKLKKVLGDSSRDGSEVPETPPGDLAVKSKSATPTALSTPAPAPASGPQFRIVDGQIIIDQSSLVMDRHARAAAVRGDMETVEENDFTRLITSSSFMNTSKLKGPNIWTEEETDLFYRGLRMFGTEFEMISKMFPNKQRRHVKLKYNREERHCPHLINAALIGEKTVRIDIDEYKAFTGIEFESVESIEAEQRKIQEDFEAEQKRIADEHAEIMRKKREELFADEDGNEDGLGKKKKKGKKRGKQTVQYGLNGEPILPGES
ncbi:transcription factor tfiiib component [Trichoderma arundinaceum]|uniref:Transcription factor tfiiib component n=1 Tax=Trichoderma arundinaceum TaxID=490622 RepID=A0A395N8W3_TRIAR|nr:transcription factor tfiiib component [Trichoderma arundinaceum]